jgi:energy-coupling factor transport system substrate-specific component
LEWLFETFSVPTWMTQVPGLSQMTDGGGWYAAWTTGDKLVYLGTMALSGLVVAGVVGWLLTTALAKAGALGAFPRGQELRETRSV